MIFLRAEADVPSLGQLSIYKTPIEW